MRQSSQTEETGVNSLMYGNANSSLATEVTSALEHPAVAPPLQCTSDQMYNI